LERGSEIFFGSKSAGGRVKHYRLIEGKDREAYLYVISNQPDRWSAAALDVTLNQMMGPIVKEMTAERRERNHRNTFEERGTRKREASPSIVRPTAAHEAVYQVLRRRRREPEEAPREASPDVYAVGRDLFPEEDEEEGDPEEESEEEEAEVVGTTHVPKAKPSRKGGEANPPPKYEATLNQDEIMHMVDKWELKQDVFEDFVTRPCCLHVLVQNRVQCLNVVSGKLTEPQKMGSAQRVFMVERQTPIANGAGVSKGPLPTSASAAGSPAVGFGRRLDHDARGWWGSVRNYGRWPTRRGHGKRA
jgi:hypothetical protein